MKLQYQIKPQIKLITDNYEIANRIGTSVELVDMAIDNLRIPYYQDGIFRIVAERYYEPIVRYLYHLIS